MAKRLADLLNAPQDNGWISMAELDAIEAAQRGQGPTINNGSLASLAPGQGYIQRTGGPRIDLQAQPPGPQDLQLDYSNPLDYMGAKGYRLKGDSNRVLLNDGRMVSLSPQADAAKAALRQKQEAADLDMQLKRADLASKQGGEWHIDSASGMMINKRSGEIKPIQQTQGGAGQVVPGNNDERLAAGYGQRMALADQLMSQIGPEGYQTTGRAVAESVPFVGGYLGRKVGTEKQGEFSQAQADWVRAKLRKESGAAIGADEMEKEISTYFPMPGDSTGVVAQKAQARQIANEAMKMAAGRAGGAVTGVRPASAQGGAQRVASDADYNALPSGATYIDPNGNTRTKR